MSLTVLFSSPQPPSQATQTIRAQLGHRAAQEEVEAAERRLEEARQEADRQAKAAEAELEKEISGPEKESEEGGPALIAEIAIAAVEVAAAASAAASGADPAAAEQSQQDVETSRAKLIGNVEALQQQANARVTKVKAAAAKSIQALCAAHAAEMSKKQASQRERAAGRMNRSPSPSRPEVKRCSRAARSDTLALPRSACSQAEFEMEKRRLVTEQAEAVAALTEMRASVEAMEEERRKLQADLQLALLAAKTSSTNALKAAQAAAATSHNYLQIDSHRAREAQRLRETIEAQTYENARLLHRLHEVEKERDALMGKPLPTSAEPLLPATAPKSHVPPQPQQQQPQRAPPQSAAPSPAPSPAPSAPAPGLQAAVPPPSRAASTEPGGQQRLADNKQLQEIVKQELKGLMLKSWEQAAAAASRPASAAGHVATGEAPAAQASRGAVSAEGPVRSGEGGDAVPVMGWAVAPAAAATGGSPAAPGAAPASGGRNWRKE